MENSNGDPLCMCDSCMTNSGKCLGGRFKKSDNPEDVKTKKTRNMFGKLFTWQKCDKCNGSGLVIERKENE